jgi:hypothetical protein
MKRLGPARARVHHHLVPTKARSFGCTQSESILNSVIIIIIIIIIISRRGTSSHHERFPH